MFAYSKNKLVFLILGILLVIAIHADVKVLAQITESFINKNYEDAQFMDIQEFKQNDIMNITLGDILFNRITLLNYQVSPKTVKTGKDVLLQFYWKCTDRIENNLRIHFQFTGPVRNIKNTSWIGDGKKLTSEWQIGEVVKDEIKIPVGSLPGRYRINAYISLETSGNKDIATFNMGSLMVVPTVSTRKLVDDSVIHSIFGKGFDYVNRYFVMAGKLEVDLDIQSKKVYSKIGFVSHMTHSVRIDQGKIVAKMRVITEKSTEEFDIRAGVHTAEGRFSYKGDKIPNKHKKATVAMDWPYKPPSPGFYHYYTIFDLRNPSKIKSINFMYLIDGAPGANGALMVYVLALGN